MARGEVRVDTDELRRHAQKLEVTAQELRKNHAAVHDDVASIAQGFGGTVVGSAMSALLEHWERETATGHKDLMESSFRHESDAASFERVDDDSKRRIQSAGGQA